MYVQSLGTFRRQSERSATWGRDHKAFDVISLHTAAMKGAGYEVTAARIVGESVRRTKAVRITAAHEL
jgi:hypothetical protein